MVDEKLNAVKKLKILQDVSALFKIIFEREGDVKIRVDTHITDTAKYVRGVVVVRRSTYERSSTYGAL